ncbi:hypothetical protein [Mangrovicoccus sp. HB161399]|uniref:hypothetical protein n=1 Tax=Mangrovicoccus sp. HB161399 TaxID=2720392 RepID=UPI001552366A|nr:hypothetical protein [Mangrovicoccus sp. HB161399]
MSRMSRHVSQRIRSGRFRGAAALRAVLAALLLLPLPAAANLYPSAVLEVESQRLGPQIRTAYGEIRAAIPEFDQLRARDLRLSVPLDGPSPLYFGNRPDSQTVVIPVESVRFAEEFAQLDGLFEARGCDRGWLQSYARALLGDGRDLPPPLEAFGLGQQDVADTPEAVQAGRDILGPVLRFLVAHEIGHLLRGDDRGPTEAHSLDEELNADRFALDRFADRRTRPEALDFYFLLERWADPGGEVAAAGVHPVSPERLQALSDRLVRDGDLFRGFRSGDIGRWQIDVLAYDLSGMARLMRGGQLAPEQDDPRFDYPLHRMADACPG